MFIFYQFNMFKIIRMSYHFTLTQKVCTLHFCLLQMSCTQAIHMEKPVCRQVISVDIITWTLVKFLNFYKQAVLLNGWCRVVILLCSSNSLHVQFLSRITCSAVVHYSMFICQCLITLNNYSYQNKRSENVWKSRPMCSKSNIVIIVMQGLCFYWRISRCSFQDSMTK